MSTRLDSLTLIEMLESSLGSIPMGQQAMSGRRARPGKSGARKASLVRLTDPKAALLSVKPRTQDDVFKLVSLASKQGIAVYAPGCLVGRNTSTPADAHGVSIDLSGLDRMSSVRAHSAVAEAGTVLGQVNRACHKHGRSISIGAQSAKALLGSVVVAEATSLKAATPEARVPRLISAKVVTIEPEPRVLHLTPAELLQFQAESGLYAIALEAELEHHAYEPGESSAHTKAREHRVV